MEINNLNYVKVAEDVIESLKVNRFGGTELKLTTSKIRNILSMVSELYNDANRDKGKVLSEELQSRVQYLKMRIAYEAGREKEVKDFEKKAELMSQIDKIGTERESLILFCRYMESLVAYHKFHGGKD